MFDGAPLYLRKPDDLLLDVYASAAEPSRWTASMDRICDAMGAYSAAVQAFSFVDGRAQVHWFAADSRSAARLAAQPAGVVDGDNPRLDHRRALRGLDRVVSDDVLFDPGDESRFRLQNRLATLGLGQFMGTLQDIGRGVYVGLALHRPAGDRTGFTPEQMQRLAQLAPHMGQAFVLTDRLQENSVRDERLREHMNRLRCGIVLCDREGRVHWVNHSASQLLGPHRTLQVRGTHLHAESVPETKRLLLELDRAGSGPGGAVRYLRLGGSGESLHVAIQSGEQSSLLVLVLTTAGNVDQLPLDALEHMFGLTPTEARLLGALATGSTLEQYAAQRGVSPGTARVQLKQIQTKTGEHRQSGLVRLVLTSAAAHLTVPSVKRLG